jgi:hypothetical protein
MAALHKSLRRGDGMPSDPITRTLLAEALERRMELGTEALGVRRFVVYRDGVISAFEKQE